MNRTSLLLLLVFHAAGGSAPIVAQEKPAPAMQELARFSAAEAHQAVAVDADSFYAITNRSVAKYSKADGERTAVWTAPNESPVKHLNSGVVIDGKLYCANSNWPKKPLRNTVEVFQTNPLKHLERIEFPETAGAINWIEKRDGFWWIVFAFYSDAEVRQTRLEKLDSDWNVLRKWTFPESVIQRFRPNSNSGGAFGPNGRLYVTGHDHAELYVLDVPSDSDEMKHIATVAAPIAGQGIAWDRSDIGVLYGIIRSKKEVVKMRLSHSAEYADLKEPTKWIRDERNPVLPPRTGDFFDATRCMNPWVVRNGDEYELYYSGGDAKGKQRIAMAVASVDDVSNWKRSNPLFETGPAGAFDARWCVLPHVVDFGSNVRHLYYTGNAGSGSGLSAFPGIGYAVSRDGADWQRTGDNPVLASSGHSGDPDAIGIAGGSVIRVKQSDGTSEWRFYYTGCPTIGKPLALNQQKTICLAVSDDGVNWIKRGAVMLRDPNRDYENIGVAGPVVHRNPDGTFRMWYSAIGTRWGYYSICYAESDDGIAWRRGKKYGDNLQLEPTGNGWEKQMVEYPSVIREGDRLRLFYCGNGYGRTGIGTAISAP